MESGSDHAAFASDTESEYIPFTLGGIGDGEAEEFDWWGAEVGDMAAGKRALASISPRRTVFVTETKSVKGGTEKDGPTFILLVR